MLGKNFGGYNFFTNNCEHFTTWRANGKYSSCQVIFRNEEENILEKGLSIAYEPIKDVQDTIQNTVEDVKYTVDDIGTMLLIFIIK